MSVESAMSFWESRAASRSTKTARIEVYVPLPSASRLGARLTRQGYNAKVLADLLNVKPREIKSFLSGHLAPGRTQELQTELLAAGIPL
jgi:hypothetical protein